LTLNILKNNSVIKTAYQISLKTSTPVYLVGGAVRDALTGFFYGKDFDFAAGDGFDELVSSFARLVKGKIIPWDFSQTRILFKKRGKYVSVDFSQFKGPDILSDLKQRDFTINSMAVDLKSLISDDIPVIIDPLRGKRDLENKIIKISSKSSFDTDPLRILRGIRFARQFGFLVNRQTLELMKRKAFLIEQVARERIKREFFAIMHLPKVLQSIQELLDIGIIQTLIPELKDFSYVTQGYPHQHNLIDHSLKTVEFLDGLLNSPGSLAKGYENQIGSYFNEEIEQGVTRKSLLMLAGILHDSGKAATRSVADDRVTFHGHEREGARLNRTIAKRLGLGKRAQKIIEQVTKNHMRLLHLSQLDEITERAKIRLLKDVDGTSLEVLFLAVSDARATSMEDAYTETVKKVKCLATQLAERVLSFPYELQTEPIITTHEVMKIMDIPEGPEVGAILREIHERERTGLVNSREDVIQWLKKRKKKPFEL
jgi:poly(A) polymerase